MLDAAIRSRLFGRGAASAGMRPLHRSRWRARSNSALGRVYPNSGCRRLRTSARNARGTLSGIRLRETMPDDILRPAVHDRRGAARRTRGVGASAVRFPTVQSARRGLWALRGSSSAGGSRHAASTVEYVRAQGTPGDDDRYPRINMIATVRGARARPCVHFNGHIDVVETGGGWTWSPCGSGERRKTLRPRRVRYEGRLAAASSPSRRCSIAVPICPGYWKSRPAVDEESGGYGGVHYLAQRGCSRRRRVDHVIIPTAQRRPRVHRPSRCVVGGKSKTHGRNRPWSMPFLGDCAVRHRTR